MTVTTRAGKRGAGWRLAIWSLLALLPMSAYAVPLWQGALADTPTAYLIWIPFLAIIWAAWCLRSTPPYSDDSELDGILGLVLMTSVGGLLVAGPFRWPTFFIWHGGGLLLWPLWALAVTWLLFGVGTTRRLIGPLLYLLLAWPPLLTAIATATQGVLLAVAINALSRFTPLISWFKPASAAGTFLVQIGGSWSGVLISQACSGADSLLAAAILIPLLMTQLQGKVGRKLLLVPVAIGGAVILNLVRLGVIIWSLHEAGSGFTFGVLHPVLGFVLFALLSVGLARLGTGLGLEFSAWPHRPAHLSLPGKFRMATAVALGCAVGVGLMPLLTVPAGGMGKPLPVSVADPASLLPVVGQFQRAEIGKFDDSSILGPNSTSVADTYQTANGGVFLAEVWMTPNGGTLRSYTYNDCLLFHGNQLQAVRPVSLGQDLVATDYAVLMPPPVKHGPRALYADIEWTLTLQTPAGVRYVRYSIAAAPSAPNAWPSTLRGASPLSPPTGMLTLAAMPASGEWPSGLTSTRNALDNFASLFANALKAHVGATG